MAVVKQRKVAASIYVPYFTVTSKKNIKIQSKTESVESAESSVSITC